jgi:hypothetical protein
MPRSVVRDIPRSHLERLKEQVPLAELIGGSLSLKRSGRFLIALCPFHVEGTPSFYVYDDHCHCYGCGAHGDAINWLIQTRRISFMEAVAFLAGSSGQTRKPQTVEIVRTSAEQGKQSDSTEFARRIWCEAVEPHGTPVETYLRHRGVRLPETDVLRFHPACPRADGKLPAMVGLMTDVASGQACGIHRTFLEADGSRKACVDKPKMMLGRAGIIRLADAVSIGLGLAEGIETALTCMQVIEWGPVWAAGSANAIRNFPVLAATTLNIFADPDSVGLPAARECARRWAAGAEALIHLPPEGSDWNDAATSAGS